MRLVRDLLRLSATDLANHLGCAHLTGLDRAAATGHAVRPRRDDPMLALLQARGEEHEREYLEHLRASEARGVVEIAADADVAATLEAMRAGAGVVYQAPLGNARWFGRADFLCRVERPSALGTWSYEVTDAKLATETRAGTILQLCVYSELVAELQGAAPERAHVVAPHHRFAAEAYRLAEYGAYYRLVRRRLEAALAIAATPAAGQLELLSAAPPAAATALRLPTYPNPVPHCDVCAWWARCNAERRADDHLCFVAGISRLQIKDLARIRVERLEQLGELRDVQRPKRGSRDALVRVRDQAAIQLEARRSGKLTHEILEPLGAEHGLARLPLPSPHDLFLDLEGDRLAADGGREYLFGYVGAAEGAQYEAVWATTAAEEKRAFETVVDRILAAFRAHPDLHVYHFGAYEPAAFKRLSGRYATRETELDTILRAELFVDLYTVVRHSLRASVESYSIKELEPFFGLHREQDLRAATASRRALEWAIEMKEDVRGALHARHDGGEAADDDLVPHIAAVERYNREDCVSAARLRDWLESLRAQAVDERGADWPRPQPKSGDASENIAATASETAAVMAALLDGVPDDAEQRDEEQHARWLLAHLLEWHRREDKASWWEYFRLKDLPLEDYAGERSALAGLSWREHVGGTAQRPIHRYAFPPQDHDIRRNDDVCTPQDGTTIGKVVDLDIAGHTLDIQHGGPHAAVRPPAIFVKRNVPSGSKPEVLLDIGRFVVAHGIDAPGDYRAARDLLLRRPPRLAHGASGVALRDAERATGAAARRKGKGNGRGGDGVDDEVAAAQRIVFDLDHGVLPIQGPPGTGKTFTGSHMILALLRAGKKVGVTAVSHEVIRNLLKGVCERAAEAGLTDFKCLHKGDAKEGYPDAIHAQDNNDRVARLFNGGVYSLLGGTSWLWARPDLARSADVLFIDEAGQMSLADVLAVARGARSLVLLGDPQQLEQPQQASHPPGAQASALEHILGGAKTIPPERGLFLHQTRRLHPDICEFTAEVFYEGRLRSFAGLERQAVLAPASTQAARYGTAGLVYVPVTHDGNQARAEEEVEAIARIVAELTADGVRVRDRDGHETPLTAADLMVVAPYNAQVTALTERLANVRVGTVDKFQGQQAPVVIVSLTTSTPDDAPRGMDFLYSANRLNVATSRAKALCILVGNPALFEPDCRTPVQMRLANAFCRYRELARTVEWP